MNKPGRVAITRLSTGVPGLDMVLGGGLPEYSFNVIAGAPGCGKTTLALQMLFAHASPERPALYFTVLVLQRRVHLKRATQLNLGDRASARRRAWLCFAASFRDCVSTSQPTSSSGVQRFLGKSS
jgi:KaiC/GvpD/RAD55 family RecA-like ATPase